MPEAQRRLILANGERYVAPVEKRHGGRPPEMPRSYGEARELIRGQVNRALEKIAELPVRKRFDDEAVLCLRLHPDMTAKTYDPQGIFAVVRDLESVGSRTYRTAVTDVAATKRIQRQLQQNVREITGRMVFVRSNNSGFRRLLRELDRPENELPKPFREEIQRIERFDLLNSNEQLLGFDPQWVEGRVELVLHPSRHSEAEQTDFLKELFREYEVPWGRTRLASYPDGPTFISCRLNRSALNAIAGANPLRTAHPLSFSGLENLRGSHSIPAPLPPETSTRSTIKVGMFDGGIDPCHPLLLHHVEQDESLSINTLPEPDYIAHGTAVAGAILYGPLNGKDSRLPLPAPNVSVVSIRALPTSDPEDMDLYESIDVIERAVPARTDIKVFNVSFGPRGPILDDTISRFTYALDALAVTHKVTFCVAVGNDGDAGGDMARIQSPADLANGLGVGAYSRRSGGLVRAPYSCYGPGRECAKIKPDLVAFGGCDEHPMHLVSAVPGMRILNWGTSFASPLVAALSAQTTASVERGTALLSRALLIHTAEHPDGDPDNQLGHGIIQGSLDHVLRCGDKEVTVIFQGDIMAKKMVKLPIMLPPGVIGSGKVSVRWTVAALPPVNPNHPSDYTALCVEDTFHPNSQVFSYSPPPDLPKAKAKSLHTVDHAVEANKLLTEGWSRSSLPVTESGNQYQSENERRVNYKWEPVVRRGKTKYATSLHEPFLVLHAIPRNGVAGRLDYAAVVTISAPKFNGDLYDAVLRRFTALQPVRLRTEAELRVQV